MQCLGKLLRDRVEHILRSSGFFRAHRSHLELNWCQCLKGRERVIVSQTSIETVSKAMLGKLLRDGIEYILVMGFSERIDYPMLN